MTKTCSKCKEIKSLEEFHRRSDTADGRRADCKTCRAKTTAIYYEANKGILHQKARLWAENNRIKMREYSKKHYEANKDQILAKARERYKLNPTTKLTSCKEYAQNNRIKIRAKTAKRRATKVSQTPYMSDLEKSMIEGLYFISQILSNSCGEPFEVDHIHPISKGGLHCFENLQILSRKDNRSKGASFGNC